MIKNLIIGAIVAVAGAVVFMVKGGSFAGVIPGVIIGIVASFVGLAFKWVVIHIMGASTNDWKDKFASILFPSLCASIGSWAGAEIIAGMLAK
jgi:putative effector of murein hydrolase LrgA (UPF0299 family)